MNHPETEEHLEGLLADWELSREAGRDLSAGELCADHPELAEELQRRIERLKATSWMLVDQGNPTWQDDPWRPGSPEQPIQEGTDTSVPEFVSSLTESGILSDDQLTEVRQCVSRCDATQADALARTLVDQTLLTTYQANVLLQGSKSPLLLDRYIILDSLGSGGMGLVFKALHRSMERIVAIKVLPPFAVNSPGKVRRFQREIKSAAKLIHPNVVTAYDAYERNGTYFLVMEYVDGINLQEHVAKHGPLSVDDAIHIVDQVAAGLDAAHQQGMVHRDVKPSNIMLTPNGNAKLLDLGLARTMQLAQNPGDQDLTKDGLAMGTASYMSPEQALDAKTSDGRSDIYSLGCTLYFLLVGSTPFARNTTVQTIVAHREAEPPSLLPLRHVPQSIEDLYQRMVAKRPEDRFQSVSEVRSQIAGDDAISPQPASNAPWVNAHHKRRSKHGGEIIRSLPRWFFATTGLLLLGMISIVIALRGSNDLRDPIHQSDPLGNVQSAQHDLAKWAIASGGWVTAETENGQQEFYTSSDIPDGPIQIVGLNLNPDSDDFSIDPIFRIETLSTLSLTGVNGIDFKRIATLTALLELHLYYCGVDGSDLQSIASLPNLGSLSLAECEITSDDLPEIVALTKLNHLDLSGTEISGEDFRLLAQFPHLQSLDLSSTRIRDSDLQYLPPKLTQLWLGSCDIGDPAAEHLRRLTLLQLLHVEETMLTGQGLAKLTSLRELADLDLSGLRISPKGLRGLQAFPSLVSLALSGLSITDAHATAMLELTNIELLDLSRSDLDDDGLMRLTTLGNLQTLVITQTDVTGAGIDRFDQKRPDCVLYIDEEQLE